jgi:hypothetical protein
MALCQGDRGRAGDSHYVLGGTHTLPRNDSNTTKGLALVVADAQGVAIMARDAYGIGNQGADISPPRWSQVHGGSKPPVQ